MKTIAIIPARYASTRFPGKPLVDIKGKTMIRRVYEQVASCEAIAEVVVATDDERIAQEVRGFGGKVVLTSSEHPSGTDRCYEAYVNYNSQADCILNVQGDEPFVSLEQLNLLVKLMENSSTEIATLRKKISTSAELFDSNKVKVVCDCAGKALYFSRQAIPFVRAHEQPEWFENQAFYKHIGLYAFRPAVLGSLVKLTQSELELAESLEQLRWLSNGYSIQTALSNTEAIAIDTPNDLEKLLQELNKIS